MQELLSKMVGRRVDVFCSGAPSLRGEVIKVEDGVLHLKDEEQQLSYVAIDKISVMWEAREKESHAGFLSGALT